MVPPELGPHPCATAVRVHDDRASARREAVRWPGGGDVYEVAGTGAPSEPMAMAGGRWDVEATVARVLERGVREEQVPAWPDQLPADEEVELEGLRNRLAEDRGPGVAAR